jgi:hypothetical protein
MSRNLFKPLAQKSDIVVQEFTDETLIYDLQKNKAFALNQTSSMVWQLCDGAKTVGEIADQLSRKLNNPVNEDLVWFALEQLKKDGLIEDGENIPNHFADLSRREVIKRVGLSSMIALPVISSLVAPMAIHAQSACPTAPCRCPNGSTSCNGSSATVGGITYVNCFSNSGNNSNCNCIGPFNPNNSAGSGFKSSTVGCTLV